MEERLNKAIDDLTTTILTDESIHEFETFDLLRTLHFLLIVRDGNLVEYNNVKRQAVAFLKFKGDM